MVALGLSACNKKENLASDEAPGTKLTEAPVYHFSIPASMGSDTKAVSFDGESGITSKFLTTDKVYVYNATKNAWARVGTGGADGFGYLQPSSLQNEGKSCTLTGDLSFYTWNSSTDSWDAVATLGSTDTYNLYYQAKEESNGDLHYSYLDLDGTQSNVSSIDYAQALGETMGLSGSTLTLNTNVPFHNYGSMFRQRLSFTGIGSAPTALRYLKVIAESGQPFISKDYLYSVNNQSTSLSDHLYVFSNSSIMDGNGDVYFAMAFSTPPTEGTLTFTAADYSGNFFSGSKALPAGGLDYGKYYYGDLALAFNRHQAMPVVTDANSDPVWPGVLDSYSIRNGTTISGDSEDFLFNLGASGGVTLTGNGTASMTSGPFLRSSALANGYGNITIILGSNYTIECPTTDAAITTRGKGYLKFATTGGTQTLTVTVKINTAKGLAGTNYTGLQAASALAADGFIVTLADDDPEANSDGTYTFVYTVTPTTVNLSSITSNYTAINGQVLTGTLGSNVKISIADGATVTLDGITINGVNNDSYQWAGLNCLGDATIILKDGTTNTLKGFYRDYPGIHVPSGSTLTIQGETAGTGSLTASSNGWGAGIGGGDGINCGNITITGGNITATGGDSAAGIGASGSCGNILIEGGTVTATGGTNAAGIGSGSSSSCGNVTITTGVTSVTAIKGYNAPYSIGKGQGGGASCGTVTILGTVYYDGSSYLNGGNIFLPTSPLYAHIPFGAVSGKFTVSNDGGITTSQVYFSKGNLKYSNYTWSFHTNQYDMCFTSTSIVSGYYTHSGTFDLFGWGTSGYQRDPDYTEGAPASYYHNGDIAGTDHDWGKYNTISNGGTGWRTPTITEWDYLLNHRTTTSGAMYARATVNSVKGLILLPDDWSISYYTLSAINNSVAAFSSNEINLSDWETVLEMHGAVFLPAFGFRYNTNICDNSGQIRSFYWSSSQYDADDPYSVRIDHNALVIDNTFPNSGGAFVRLVKDAN